MRRYRWFIGQHEDNPGEPDRWIAARWALTDELEAARTGDPRDRLGNARATHSDTPHHTDRANAAQFLASQGEVLTPAARGMFLDAVIAKLLTATSLLDRRARGDDSRSTFEATA